MSSRYIRLALVAALFAPAAVAQTVTDPRLQVETLVTGLTAPINMVFVDDGDILVLKRNGAVRRVIGGVLQPDVVLDVAVSDTSGDRGALGLAVDPDFVNNGGVYIYFTESSTGADGGAPAGNRLYRYTWNGSSLVNPQQVLDLPADPGPNHNGGPVLFGPDDRLYLVIGDLHRNGQLQNIPSGAGPDDTSVIFRVDATGSPLSDNPFYDPGDPSNPLSRYLAYGVRNCFGLDFDPLTGDLWNSENGPSNWDELNRVEPASNSGWRQIMGPDDLDPQNPSDLWMAPGSFYSDPEFSWNSPVAPTAVAFAESPVLGCDLQHDLFVGDVNCNQIYHFELAVDRRSLSFQSPELQDLIADNAANPCSDEMSEIVFGTGFSTITDIQNGPDGLLYVLSFSGLYRIRPIPGAVTDADGDNVDDSCDCDVTEPTAFAVASEVPRIRVSGRLPTLLGWDSQSSTAGTGTTYDVVSGEVSALKTDGSFDSSCTLGSVGTTTLTDSRPDPAPGDAYYYMVRAANACGLGTFGSGSPDNHRDAIQLALPPACPSTAGS